MAKKWLIKNGNVVFPEWGVSKVDVLVNNGVIASVADSIQSGSDVETYDAEGMFVFPGFIDCHVHLGNNNDFVDDVKTETAAAATGGVTSIMTFIKVLRHVDEMVSYKKLFDTIVDQINTYSSIDIGMHLCISTREHISEIKDYTEMGASSFKFYMGYRGDPVAMKRGSVGISDGMIYLGFKEVGKLPPPALAMTHCENDEINQVLEAEMGDDAYRSYLNWVNTRPIVGEAETISRTITFAREAGCPIYIVHCSSKAGLDKIRQMRQEGETPIYAEATPFHLTLTAQKCHEEIDWPLAKTTPPPRDETSIEALWEGIKQGDIDCVATDHCATTIDHKKDFKPAHMGWPGMETFPALMITEATKRGIPLQTIAKVCIYNPAKIFGLLPHKGTLRPGADADISIFNLNANAVVDSSKFHSMAKFSPIDGWKLTAQAEATMLRGEFIYRRGEPVVKGRGKALLDRKQAADV